MDANLEWWEEPEFVKAQDSRLLDSAILNRTQKIVFLPELIEELKLETDFTEDEIKFNIWRLLGEGTLVRINGGFYITTSPTYIHYAYTVATNARTRGV